MYTTCPGEDLGAGLTRCAQSQHDLGEDLGAGLTRCAQSQHDLGEDLGAGLTRCTLHAQGRTWVLA